MGALSKFLTPFTGNNFLAKVSRKIDPTAAAINAGDKKLFPKKAAPAAPVSHVMPDEDDEGIAAAKRRRLAGLQGSSGRASTIISAGETRLGG